MTGKKLCSPLELFTVMYRGARSVGAMKSDAISKDFKERIMLAVTQVNGCAMCSYAHTQMALESGMSQSEISNLLSGETENCPPEQAAAVMFAQHYADSRGKPSKESIQRIKQLYGEKQANAIFGAVCVIMTGNSLGIPLGSLKARFSKDAQTHDSRSTLIYEIAMLLCAVIYLPFVLVFALAANLLGLKLF